MCDFYNEWDRSASHFLKTSGLTPDTYGNAPAAVVGFGAPGGLRGLKMLSVQRMQFSVVWWLSVFFMALRPIAVMCTDIPGSVQKILDVAGAYVWVVHLLQMGPGIGWYRRTIVYKCTKPDVYEWTTCTLGSRALEYLCTLHHIHVYVYLAKSHHNIRRQASDNGIFVIIQYCCIRAA